MDGMNSNEDDYHQGNWRFHCEIRPVITLSTTIDQFVMHWRVCYPRWSREWKMKLPEIIFGDNSLKISLDGCEESLIVGFVDPSDSRYRLSMSFSIAARRMSLIRCEFNSIHMS